MLLRAFLIAKRAHHGQYDKGGHLYIRHPLQVALHVKGRDCRAVALLHDVLEDSVWTADDLLARGISPCVVEAVEVLTKREGEAYSDYLARVKRNPIARTVKLADLAHNSDLRRIPHPTQTDYARVQKYRAAMDFLRDNGGTEASRNKKK